MTDTYEQHQKRAIYRLLAIILLIFVLLLFFTSLWWWALIGMNSHIGAAWMWTIVVFAITDGVLFVIGWYFA